MRIESIQNIFQSIRILSLSSVSSKPLVILIKKLFIIMANCFSFGTRFSFSLWRSSFEFSPLFVKCGLIVFQNILLLDKSRMFKFRKQCFGFRQQVHPKIPLFFIICPIIISSPFVTDIFNLDLCVIAFLSALVMKRLLLNRRIFFFIGT